MPSLLLNFSWNCICIEKSYIWRSICRAAVELMLQKKKAVKKQSKGGEYCHVGKWGRIAELDCGCVSKTATEAESVCVCVRDREEKSWNWASKKTHRICNRIHDWGYNWECNYCYCDKPIMRPGYFATAAAFTHLAAGITTMRAHVKCALFVHVKHTVYSPPDKFPLPIHLSAVLFWICAFLKSELMIRRAFSCRRKNPIRLISQAKIWAAQQNLISCVSYSSAAWYSHGNALSAARITVRSVRAVSYLDMKVGKMEEGGVKAGWGGGERETERGGERLGSPGNYNTWKIHWAASRI